MKRRFTAYPQSSIKASKRIYSASDISDFEIDEDGVLIKYHGNATNVVIPGSVTSIGDNAFKFRNIAKIRIPNSVTSIGDFAFDFCTSLKSITIPSSVTSIGMSAFANCDSLESIAIPDSVVDIDDWAFGRCERLTSVTIPSSVTSIGDYAFYHCTNLTNIKIPNSVTGIGHHAFEGCEKLSQNTKNYISQLGGVVDIDVDYTSEDTRYDEEIALEEWYRSEEGESDGMQFIRTLQTLVNSKYSVEKFLNKCSGEELDGEHFLTIILEDRSIYEFEFNWYDEQSRIYSDGPETAAESYFEEIQEGIDSGSALAN